MPLYVYETIPQSDAEMPQQFELRQSMNEPRLSAHPESGVPVRRVLSGGLTTMTRSGSAPRGNPSGGMGCGSGCGCVS